MRSCFRESQFKSFSALTGFDNPLYLIHSRGLETCCYFAQAEIRQSICAACLFSEGTLATFEDIFHGLFIAAVLTLRKSSWLALIPEPETGCPNGSTVIAEHASGLHRELSAV